MSCQIALQPLVVFELFEYSSYGTILGLVSLAGLLGSIDDGVNPRQHAELLKRFHSRETQLIARLGEINRSHRNISKHNQFSDGNQSIIVRTLREEKLPASIERALDIVKTTKQQGLTVRLLGGHAVGAHCHGLHPAHLRTYQDIDLFGFGNESEGIVLVLKDQGYLPDERFNVLHGASRLKFLDKRTHETLDVFLDVFKMDHILDFHERLYLDDLTIPLTDLFLTKVQITKLTSKDITDIIAILEDHDVAQTDSQDMLNADYVAELCSDDWPLWKGVTDSLGKFVKLTQLGKYTIYNNEKLMAKVKTIREAIDFKDKTLRWKLRSHVGVSVKWYFDVED